MATKYKTFPPSVKYSSKHYRERVYVPVHVGLIPLNNKSEVIRLSETYVKRINIS